MPDAAVTAVSPRGWTVTGLAQRFRVSEEKIRGWIRRGELIAINTADARCGKPRYIVTAEALAQFERGRAAAAPDKAAPRRKRRTAGMIDFYPDSD
jgi:hypothetical protein